MHHVVEDCSHSALVSRTRILQFERHHCVIEITDGCSKSNLLHAPGCHSDLVIATKSIHERKHSMPYDKIYQLVHVWQGELVLRVGLVEVFEIHTASDLSILLLDWYNIGQPLRVLDRLNESCRKKFLHLLYYMCLNINVLLWLAKRLAWSQALC